MNLHTVKWTSVMKPNPENCQNCSSKCVCTTSVHNTIQNSSDNLPSYLLTTVVAQLLSIGGELGRGVRFANRETETNKHTDRETNKRRVKLHLLGGSKSKNGGLLKIRCDWLCVLFTVSPSYHTEWHGQYAVGDHQSSRGVTKISRAGIRLSSL